MRPEPIYAVLESVAESVAKNANFAQIRKSDTFNILSTHLCTARAQDLS